PNCSVSFSSGPTLTWEQLRGQDVLVITTRYPAEVAYADQELSRIWDFVRLGGGLLLMSNHGDLPGHNPHDMTLYDARVVNLFGISLECSWFQNPAAVELSVLSGRDFLASHPIIGGREGGEAVKTIVTNNCSSIVAEGLGYPLVSLSQDMLDLRNGNSPQNRLFAHALDPEEAGSLSIEGRVVTLADSGFIGDEGTNVPGPGLIDHGDNAQFIKNVVRWLGRQLS
ncbi:MAG: hypothetical protein ACE5Q6_18380, partial [Dehalococcoidia bacterium]